MEPSERAQLLQRRPGLLLVGGRRILLKALERGLTEEGFAVDNVGEEMCREKLLAGGYEAIILDVALPEQLAVVRAWRRQGVEARIIALTPWPIQPEEHGIDEVFLKPFLFASLLDRLTTPGVSAFSCNGDST